MTPLATIECRQTRQSSIKKENTMLDLIRTCALVSAATLMSIAAFAGQSLSADDLLDRCQQDTAEFCQGYIAGVADSAQVCVPEDIQTSTLVDLAISSLKTAATPAEVPATDVISARLLEVFPCDSDNKEDSTKSTSSKSKNWSNKERIGK